MSLSTSTSLTLRALLKSAAARAGAGTGVPGGRVSGLSPAAKAFFVAVTAANETVVVIVPGDGDIEQQVADARFFLVALEGLSDQHAERVVLPFPSHEVDPFRGLSPHFDVASARARALHALATGTARIVVASAGALLPRLSPPARLLAASIELRIGGGMSPTRLGAVLGDAGFSREDPVDEHGEFCVRGGVVDVFAAGDTQPLRVEFIGDTVESIRRYDPATQRSVAPLDYATVVPVRELFERLGGGDREPGAGGQRPGAGDHGSGIGEGVDEGARAEAGGEVDRSATFFDYVAHGRRAVILVSEADDVRVQAEKRLEQIAASYVDAVGRGAPLPAPEQLLVAWPEIERRLARAVRLDELAIEDAGPLGPGHRHIACQPGLEFRGRVGEWVADVRRARERGDTVLVVVATTGRAERVVALLAEYELAATVVDRAGEAPSGAALVATGKLSRGFRLPASALQIYAETDVFVEDRRVHPERRRSPAGAFVSDFRDLKVGDHVVHVEHGIGVFVGLRQLEVGGERQEFVELRYADGAKLFVPVERLDLVQKYTGAARPALDRLGGTTWERTKTRVRRAVRDMAEELLKLYAARKAVRGHAFSPDTHWQREFDEGFEYELTPDQQTAIAEIKRDMEMPVPMDRLLCGDVGYGKTEVAMRAAFKAVMDGKQVAVLAPTTVLVFQHFKTLRERFADFPIRVEMISRFRSPAEQRQVLADLAAGRVDIIVGTHRLLSKDVQVRELGLLVVDEEQRFGVAHKERLKQMRRKVDVLTMTATPIPRTLNMSMVGIRDLSIIETPPKDRLAIQTNVVRFDPQLVAQAIRHELARGGQVYFVHNRVESIYAVGDLLQRLVGEARVVVAHGQLSEDALERCMIDFIDHRHDILLATTIIENGLDIPNVNTIIVNHAEQCGLAQLYQLRGRVGRADRRAYAYLLVPPQDSLSPVARRRLAAIREFSDLGSGFRVAALDLEIRGGGNLLGPEQSGHIEAVGFDMYMKLLEQTVRELKGEAPEEAMPASVNLHVDLRIDERYIPDMNQRLTCYRRVAAARNEAELARVLDEVRDRYGPMPPSVDNLAAYGRIRILADGLGIESLDREGQTVVVRFRRDTPVDPHEIIRLVQRRDDVTLVPPASLKLDLRRPPAAARRSEAPDRRQPVPASWWTKRATAGEVTPGFSKAEMLRATTDEAALVGRVAELLAELSGAA